MTNENELKQKVKIFFDNISKSRDFATNCTQMILRVCAYARVSTDSEEQKTSYESQKQHYEELIKGNPNWEFVGIYADEGISGTQMKKRDDFNRMLQDALNGKIDMIIAKSISRFARNTVDTLNVVRLLRSHNVDVYFEKENIHTMSMTNELFLTFYSAFAQGESESISENLKRGLSYKMERGEMVGQPAPFGYDYNKEKKTITINKKQAIIVKRIFEEYASGKGIVSIARDLNDEGILSATNRKWIPESIRKILNNEKYIGDLCTGKTFVVNVIEHKKKRNDGEQKKYYTENHHEAIISKELWDKAHEIYKKRSDIPQKHRDKYSRRYAFSSKIYCGFCGERYVRKSYLKDKNDPNSRIAIWGCRSHNHSIPCENHITYKEEELKTMFLITFNEMFRDYEQYFDAFLKKIDIVLNKENILGELDSLQKEKNNLLEKQSKLLDLFVNENISTVILNKKISSINAELALVEEKIKKCEDSKALRLKKVEQIEKIKNVLKENPKLDKFDDKVFESIVDKIIIGEVEEDGTFNYKAIKFILKTGEVISNSNRIDKLLKQVTEKSHSSINVTVKKIDSDKSSGISAYIQCERLWICY